MPVKRNENGAFALSKLPDAGLAQLQQDVNDEIIRREAEKQKRKREEKRIQWITSHIRQYKNCTANHEVVGKTVVVAVQWYGHVVIAKATPIKGDVFDLDTGIAVAFAKAMGECIPDYI